MYITFSFHFISYSLGLEQKKKMFTFKNIHQNGENMVTRGVSYILHFVWNLKYLFVYHVYILYSPYMYNMSFEVVYFDVI